MILHIFKKDWRLLWPMVVGVALLHFLDRFGRYKMGHFNTNPVYLPLLMLLRYGGYLASAFLIAFVAEQDAVPGVRQDWLVRPISRRDLLLAKILFVLVLVQGPMIAADAFEGLLDGFSLGQSLAAALSRGLGLLPFVYLALLAFTALTQNLVEAIAGGVLVFLAGGGIMLVIGSMVFNGRPEFWVEWSGLSWVSLSERILVSLFISIAILSLLYFRRKVVLSRWIFVVGVVLWMLTIFTPWNLAFAVQKWASGLPVAARSIAVDFAPSLGRHKPSGVPAVADVGRGMEEVTIPVSLPLHISGLPNDVVLRADLYQMRVIGPDHRAVNAGFGRNFEIFNEGAPHEIDTHQPVRVLTAVYQRIKEQPVNLEIEYSFTLLRLAGSYGFSPSHDDQRNTVLGWCKTQVNGDQTAVQLRCMKPTSRPSAEASCASGFLENRITGKRNPERFACTPDYSPFMESMTDSFTRSGLNIPFRDPTGLAQYAVDGSQLTNSRAVVRVYTPEEHFSRRVVIPSIRLAEWAVQ